jgi:hypothetical protein
MVDDEPVSWGKFFGTVAKAFGAEGRSEYRGQQARTYGLYHRVSGGISLVAS